MGSKNPTTKPGARPRRIARRKKPKTAARRRHSPRAQQADDQKLKVSIALSSRDVAWLSKVADERSISVSGVVQEALQYYKRDQDLGALLELVGGTEDITREDLEAVRAEWRGAGIKL
jgi:hypothetical protein